VALQGEVGRGGAELPHLVRHRRGPFTFLVPSMFDGSKSNGKLGAYSLTPLPLPLAPFQ
jgi:hypothetical protein